MEVLYLMDVASFIMLESKINSGIEIAACYVEEEEWPQRKSYLRFVLKEVSKTAKEGMWQLGIMN